jgi:hypothetical protein
MQNQSTSARTAAKTTFKSSLLFRPAQLAAILLLAAVFSGCFDGSKVKDMQPIVDGRFKDAKAVFYPSTDFKVAAIVVDKDGNVWYLRLNGDAEMRDEKQLFNVSQYCR